MTDIETLLRHGSPTGGASPPTSAAFAERADRAGLVDVGYEVIPSPLGPILVAATPAGIVQIAYAEDRVDSLLDTLSVRISPRVLELPERVGAARHQLTDYFAGRRRDFDVPLDWRLVGPFAAQVLRHTATLGFGRTSTYGQVASALGRPGAARAVGNALGSNPLVIVLPCHRVLRTGGGLGGYTTGVAKKEYLLGLEGVAL
jgi:methylated-DNA-[protein]-cysteine S-methyltransferase